MLWTSLKESLIIFQISFSIRRKSPEVLNFKRIKVCKLSESPVEPELISGRRYLIDETSFSQNFLSQPRVQISSAVRNMTRSWLTPCLHHSSSSSALSPPPSSSSPSSWPWSMWGQWGREMVTSELGRVSAPRCSWVPRKSTWRNMRDWPVVNTPPTAPWPCPPLTAMILWQASPRSVINIKMLSTCLQSLLTNK